MKEILQRTMNQSDGIRAETGISVKEIEQRTGNQIEGIRAQARN